MIWGRGATSRCGPGDASRAGLWAGCDRNEDETAVRADVPRPRVYSELARIQLGRARGRPAGKDGKLSIGQTETVLELVEKAERLWPRDASTMTSAAQALVNSDHVAEPGNFARIERALRDFPNDLDLLWHASAFYVDQGNLARAKELAMRGRALAEKKPMEERFDQLVGKLGARP